MTELPITVAVTLACFASMYASGYRRGRRDQMRNLDPATDAGMHLLRHMRSVEVGDSIHYMVTRIDADNYGIHQIGEEPIE